MLSCWCPIVTMALSCIVCETYTSVCLIMPCLTHPTLICAPFAVIRWKFGKALVSLETRRIKLLNLMIRFSVLIHYQTMSDRQTDGQTDRQTDRQTDGQVFRRRLRPRFAVLRAIKIAYFRTPYYVLNIITDFYSVCSKTKKR